MATAFSMRSGHIIYLNPDHHWWFRRTLDRILGDVLIIPYASWVD